MPINCAHVHGPEGRTRGQLRTAIMEALGLPDPLTGWTPRTLGEVRTTMLRLLGYGAMVANPGPGVADTLNAFINEAQQALARRLELGATLPAYLTGDADVIALDPQPVQTLALAMYCASKGKPEAKAYFEQHEKYVADTAARRPPGIVAKINRALDDAQTTLLRRVPQLQAVRWFAWPLTVGERFYAYPSQSEPLGLSFDPLAVFEAHVERGTERTPLVRGLPGRDLARDITGVPSHFDLRECIELWPAPGDSDGRLLIRARHKPAALTDDAHVPAIDDMAVYLLALADLQAFYKQPMAGETMGKLEVRLSELVAGTHGARRYIPGGRDPVQAQPIVRLVTP